MKNVEVEDSKFLIDYFSSIADFDVDVICSRERVPLISHVRICVDQVCFSLIYEGQKVKRGLGIWMPNFLAFTLSAL